MKSPISLTSLSKYNCLNFDDTLYIAAEKFICQCPLQLTFANSLDPYQARQNVGPDMDPICLTLSYIPEELFENIDLKKRIRQKMSKQNFPACKALT